MWVFGFFVLLSFDLFMEGIVFEWLEWNGTTKNDWFFKCHLEREKLMPGTLQIEAMLQTLVLAIYTIQGHKGKLSYVTDISTKLLSSVSPDSQLDIYADLLSYNRGIAKGVAVGKIDDSTVCQGEFTFISPHDMPLP